MYSIKWYNYIATQVAQILLDAFLKYCVIYNSIVCLKIFRSICLNWPTLKYIHIVTHLYVYHLFAIEIFLNIFSSTHTFSSHRCFVSSSFSQFRILFFCSWIALEAYSADYANCSAYPSVFSDMYIYIYLYVFPWCIHEFLCVYSWVRALLILVCGHLSALGLNYCRQHVNPFMTKYLSHPIIQKLT